MKRPLDIHLVMERIGEMVKPFPKAAMFELADEGFDSPFEQLIACLISIRTRDEVTLICARKLFGVARSPAQLAQLPIRELDELIRACAFHESKAPQIQRIAQRVAAQYQEVLPCDDSILLSFQGIGPKCTNLVLGVACHETRISVDTHVHRVTNRWGYVQTSVPEQTMKALETILPRQYWVKINRLLVPFGKHICTGSRPRCSTCGVLDMCRQIGVKAHR